MLTEQIRRFHAPSDVTYLHTGEGWAYLCVVRGGNTRLVLGRTVADNLNTDLVEDTLREAAAEYGVLRSISHTGVCRDNARRRHSVMDYLSPLEYERRQLTLAA